MKLVSWNVNGIRACLDKGFIESMNSIDADIICLQETKAQEEQVDLHMQEYYQYWNSAVKKGYSGTLVLTKIKPLAFTKGIDIEHHDQEGRVITLEYNDFYLVNVYTPNSQRELTRLEYRQEWEDDFKEYLLALDKIKPVVLCGDLNVAHQEIDLANPKTNTRNAGFTIEERNKFSKLLEAGFIDTYRYLNPDQEAAYTWWSYMRKARERNIGWRIDYFCISHKLADKLMKANIYPEIYGSDHCPISIDIDLKG
ncbi:exodeoxyribonuclease III [Erysipelotrichaceae bacterium OttesenSCG-928-M19]|nr:exodeoxyribonuclease III [Erysipelotrichaceae bacterium OttesenSCG-928-M19]